ncbi:MAG: Gfo/Idh/MocA family oxidoreductase [Clostridia bacterium]|nr:Gfo/Idh/MocA family oxidoreductase [Clostridia bacterium]
MSCKLRIVVVGCGRFAQSFVPLFKAHPVVEKVWVCDLKKDREEDYARRFGVDRFSSFEDALRSPEVNAVAIFTQRFKHGPMVIEALKAGKHVYSSVPCAISVDEIVEIEKLIRETRLTYSMGETGFYRAPAIFCREEFNKGTFGKFVYGEAQYNHDIRNMEDSFRSSGVDDWRSYAGIPPFFYPSHSTAMILSAMPGVYATKVTALGFSGSPRTDIYGTDGQNLYNNPFSSESMLMQLSNGGIARISENRCIGWKSPETYITQFYGSEGGYEFSVAHHHLAVWDKDDPKSVVMKDVSEQLQPESVYDLMKKDYGAAIQAIADSFGFTETSPIQPTERIPKEFDGLPNRHNGTHHFLIDDFCRAFETGKLSPTNIWAVARFNIPGLVAHQSALQGSIPLDVPDLGDPPADWPVLDYKTMDR